MSDYRIQIVHKNTGKVAMWRAGKDPIETDLVEDLAARLARRGVGVFKTQAKVLMAVREEFAAMLHDLKLKV